MDISVSKISFYSILFFIFGIGSASFLSVPFYVYIPLFLLFLILALLLNFSKKKLGKIWLLVFCITFFIFGVFRYQASIPDITENHISFYNGQKAIFQAQVVKEPDERIDKIKLILGHIILKDSVMQGKVLINVPLYSDYKYGDVLSIECKLQEPGIINQFNYNEYLARYDIYSTCYWPKINVLERGQGFVAYKTILSFKSKAKDLIDFNFTEPQGSFLSAIILGMKRQIPEEMRDWFARSGTAHILAISGLHISILTQLIMIFFITVLAIPKIKVFWPTAVIITLFVILAGAPSSAIRASIMGLALLYAQKLGRSVSSSSNSPYSGLAPIFLAAAVMLLFNPKLLKVDIGFQLSFAAVLGIKFFSQRFNYYFKKVPEFKFFPIRQYLSTSLSAQVFVLPLILYYFGNLSLAAPLANILILPVLPIIMILGFSFIIFGFIHILIAKFISWPIWFLLTYIILIARITSYASFILIDFPFIAVVILYVLIILFILRIKKNEQKTS